MNYIREEREIYVNEFIYSIVCKWRRILLFVMAAIIVAIVVNAPGAVKYMDVLGKMAIIKELAKYTIIVGVIVVILAIFYYAVKFFFTDVIKSSKELRYVVSLNILGCIYKKSSKIDALLKKICGFKLNDMSSEEYVEHFAKTLETEISVRGNDNIVTVAVVSSNSFVEAKEVVDLTAGNVVKGIKIVEAGDIMNSAKAVEQVVAADYVILAERREKSKYKEIEETCKRLEAWKKDILGIVLLDAE